MTQSDPPAVPVDRLYKDIRHLIESARSQIVTQVNQALVFTYWQIGKTITTELMNDGRAQYGAATMDVLAEKLVAEYAQGYGRRNLFRMTKFYQHFPNIEIVTTVSAQLSWSHFVEIIRIEDAIKRAFYIRMATDGRWSVRILRESMDGVLFAVLAQTLRKMDRRGRKSDTAKELAMKDGVSYENGIIFRVCRSHNYWKSFSHGS